MAKLGQEIEMEVYFNRNFWNRRSEGGIPGVPKPADWEFTYDGSRYFIPKIYQFPEGVTIDIINILDNEKLKFFYDKYAPIEDEMNEEENLVAEQERPIPELPLHDVYINDHPTEIKSSSVSYISFLNKKWYEEVLSEIKKEYGLSDEESFQCIRVHVEYSNESQKKISRIKLLTSKTDELIPVKRHFKVENKASDNQYDVVFRHPLTEEEYHLYIAEAEFKDIRLVFPHYDQSEPYNNAMIKYELVPPLPKDERIAVREIKQKDIKDRNYAAVIGYISNGETGKNGYPIEYAISNMYWKALEFAEFSIVGIYKTKCTEKEIVVFDEQNFK